MQWIWWSESSKGNTWKGTQWILWLCEKLPIFYYGAASCCLCVKSTPIRHLEFNELKTYEQSFDSPNCTKSWEYWGLGEINEGLVLKKVIWAKLNSKSSTKLNIWVILVQLLSIKLKTTRKVLTVQTVLKLRRLRAWEERREPSSEKSCVQTSPAFGLQY